MFDVLAAPQQAKPDTALRTLVLISIAHWVSHFHLLVLPMLFPFLKGQLGVGYIGGAVAPAIVAALVGVTGGLGALIVAGAVGPLVALVLIAGGLPDASAADRKVD